MIAGGDNGKGGLSACILTIDSSVTFVVEVKPKYRWGRTWRAVERGARGGSTIFAHNSAWLPGHLFWGWRVEGGRVDTMWLFEY